MTNNISTYQSIKSNENNFQHRKEQCLGKRDKSSAGKIDEHALDICNLINTSFDEYYTTSSCSGRCFIYKGIGKSQFFASVSNTTTTDGGADGSNDGGGGAGFVRYRVNHDKIVDAERYFDLDTLEGDATGGGDVINEAYTSYSTIQQQQNPSSEEDDKTLWLRFEPFILHIACSSLEAAYNILRVTRPTFKNIGLTSWNESSNKYLVAIWGDEGIDLPLVSPGKDGVFLFQGREKWLADLVNGRHVRNWAKIDQLVNRIQEEVENGGSLGGSSSSSLPKRYDVIGDVALFHSLPVKNTINDDNPTATVEQQEEWEEMAQSIMHKNKSINVCVARTTALQSYMRSPSTLTLLASKHPNRSIHPSLLTTHVEYGVPCLIDVTNTFFTPRMSFERQRLVTQVLQSSEKHEKVLIPFAGCGMEAFLIAYQKQFKSMTLIEMNTHAVRCLHRSLEMLAHNVRKTDHTNIVDSIYILEDNVLDICPALLLREGSTYDRIIAPRPKYEKDAPDLLDEDDITTKTGIEFLKVLIPLLKPNVGICHWYDFAAFHELPDCVRTKTCIEQAYNDCFSLAHTKKKVEVLNVVNVTSVAKKQYRVCIDFRIVDAGYS